MKPWFSSPMVRSIYSTLMALIGMRTSSRILRTGCRSYPIEASFVETSLQTADLPRLLDGITHVFHLAAQAGVRKSWGSDFATYVTHNIDGTQRLLEAVKQARIEKLVYASSSSIYGDEVEIPMREDAVPRPVSPYGG